MADTPWRPHIQAMLKTGALLTDQAGLFDDDLRAGAEIVDLDTVAVRRERLLAYADLTRPVIVYRFAIPTGATLPGLGTGVARDARAQLELIVGLTGGAVAKNAAGLAVRVPKILAAKFEALAGPLVSAYLVSLELDAAAQA